MAPSINTKNKMLVSMDAPATKLITSRKKILMALISQKLLRSRLLSRAKKRWYNEGLLVGSVMLTQVVGLIYQHTKRLMRVPGTGYLLNGNVEG